MKDQEKLNELDPQQEEEQQDPCLACHEESPGCGGCGSERKRVDPWWYLIAALAILLVAVLISRWGSGST